MKKWLFLCCYVSPLMLLSQSHTYQISIRDKGALPDGVSNNAAAIQQAINDVHQHGGGTVFVPRGRYATGPIELKSNVTLHIHPEAVLLASIHILDYKQQGKTLPLIRAKDASYVSITGGGLIDGQADYLMVDVFAQLRAGTIQDKEWKEIGNGLRKRPGEASRPKLIELNDCKNVTVKHIRLQNGTSWIQDYRNCDSVAIDSIDVFSNTYWNNDGLDITDSKNVRITNCRINAADDAICLKSENRNSRCENVYIANCVLRSSANAVKLGTASWGGFTNIQIEDIKVYDTYRSVLALEVVDGGVLENVVARRMEGINTGNALLIRLGHRNKDSVYSKLRNVQVYDLTVQVPAGKPDAGYNMEGPLLKYPPGFQRSADNPYESVSPWNHSSIDSAAIVYPHNVFPASITGLPGHYPENIYLENIQIHYAGGGDSTVQYFPLESFKQITEAPTAYPEFSMFGELPAWGLYVRHVKDLRMHNVQLNLQQKDYRIAVLMDDVQQLSMNKLSIPACQALPVMLFHQVKNYKLNNITLPVAKQVGLHIQ